MAGTLAYPNVDQVDDLSKWDPRSSWTWVACSNVASKRSTAEEYARSWVSLTPAYMLSNQISNTAWPSWKQFQDVSLSHSAL